MHRMFVGVVAGLALALAQTAVADNRVEGVVDAIDPEAQAFTVQLIQFHTDAQTQFGERLARFEGLEVGQWVEVEFEMRNGRYYATAVERQDDLGTVFGQ